MTRTVRVAEIVGQPARPFQVGKDLPDAVFHRDVEQGSGVLVDDAFGRHAMPFLKPAHCLVNVVVVSALRMPLRFGGQIAGELEAQAQGPHARVGRPRAEDRPSGRLRPAPGRRQRAIAGEGLSQLEIDRVGRRQTVDESRRVRGVGGGGQDLYRVWRADSLIPPERRRQRAAAAEVEA